VHVFVTKPIDGFTPVAAHQLDILNRMNVPVDQAVRVTDSEVPDVVLDGVIGYSLKGAPRNEAARLIRWANAQSAPVLALDAPSGVDTTTGTVFDPAVRAIATLTLALPKEGLRAPGVENHVGELYLADISVPPALYANDKLDLSVGPIFAAGDIVRLH
jgi:NAD(P)H-hydrate epimerase